jgi:hypothetical protein
VSDEDEPRLARKLVHGRFGRTLRRMDDSADRLVDSAFTCGVRRVRLPGKPPDDNLAADRTALPRSSGPSRPALPPPAARPGSATPTPTPVVRPPGRGSSAHGA